MATHPAIVATGLGEPLQIAQFPTQSAQADQVRFRIEWVPSAPLDVFQVDAGLMAKFPQSLGDTAAGTVVEVGPEAKRLRVGDKVFGFFFQNEHQKAMQIFATVPEHLLAKVPNGVSLPAVATVPNNFVTAFYTLNDRLGLDLPWPRPQGYVPPQADRRILIWGASSSVGQYAVQILHYWGYTNIIATASPKHHDMVKSYGAKAVVDYRDSAVVSTLRDLLGVGKTPQKVVAMDCVDSKTGSLLPISQIVTEPGSAVAAVLPVVVSSPGPSNPETKLQLEANVTEAMSWPPGVTTHSIVTYTYEANEFLRDHVQPNIMPTLLAEGAVRPNKFRIIEGETLLERAQKALDIMRSGTVSGERLVWPVWTEKEFPQYA